MGNTMKVNKHRNRLIAMMLVISLFTSIMPMRVPASAYEPNMQNGIYAGLSHTCEANGYSVELTITDAWQGACNARLVIKNTGETTVDNWALAFDTGCEITNIWNAIVVDKENVSIQNVPLYRYTIKNAGHNKDIPIGAQIEIGFSMNIPADQASVIIPSSFSMVQNTLAISEDQYTVYSFIYGDTNYNYNGYFVIRNDSDTTIEDWVLGFATDIDVIDFHTAELIERQENSYLIKNRGYNSEIKPGEQIFIGFTAKGTYGVQVDGSVTDTYMTDVRIGVTEEHTPSITMPITPVPTVTIEPTVTVTETPTEVVTPEPTVTEEVTPTEVVTPEPTVTEEVTPTEIVTIEPTITEEITPTAVISPTEEITPTEVITPTDEPTPTETITPIPTEIVTEIPTPSIYDEFTEEELWSDEDGDYLPLAYELELGTDPLKADTDDDGISDYIETVNGLDPLTPDNEFEGEVDSDSDDLYDWEELFIYNTDPLNPDTDGDGLDDGFEISNGFDPMLTDTDGDGIPDGEERFEQTVIYDTARLGNRYKELVSMSGQTITLFGEDTIVPETIGAIKKVSVSAEVSGDIDNEFDFTNMFGESVILTYTPGMVGIPFDITTSAGFDQAILSFEYDETLIGGDETDLRIAWYNEEEGIYEIFEDYVLDEENNTISCVTEHFSSYVLLNIKLLSEDWKRSYVQVAGTTKERMGKNSIQICIDVGCDYYFENSLAIKESLKRINNVKLDTDRIGIQAVSYTYKEKTESHSSVDYGNSYRTELYSIGFKSGIDKEEIQDYLKLIRKREKYATLQGELDGIKEYFESNNSDNTKKAVVWITSSTLSSSVFSGVQEYISYFNSNGIKLHQVYVGDIIDAYKDEVKTNLSATGGYLYEANNKNSIEGLFNNCIGRLNGYDVLLVINSGSYPVKEKWEELLQNMNRLSGNDEITKIGLLDVYDVSKDEVPYNHYSGDAGWYAFNDIGWLNNSGLDIVEEIEGLTTEVSKCPVDFEYQFMSEYFDFFEDKMNVNERTVLMISADTINNIGYAKYFEKAKATGTRMFLIYVGEEITDSKKEEMRTLFRGTGGDAFFAFEDIYEAQMFEKGRCDTISKTTSNGKDSAENFDDMISLFMARAIGLSDGQDSDGDGLTDCREINGMVLPNSKIVQSDPRDSDTDKDGLTDGEEMNVGTKVYTYREWKNLLADILIYDVETDMDNDIFTAYYGTNSDPTKEDTDEDGYLDFGWGKDGVVGKDRSCFVINVHISQIDNPDEYVPVYLKDGVDPDYGGNQGWFSHSGMQLFGCGVTAAENVLLYYALQNSDYITPVLKEFFPHIVDGKIYRNEYVRFGDELFDIFSTYNYFSPVTLLGVQPKTMQRGFYRYFNDFDIPFVSTYISAGADEIEDQICYVLEKDKPVIFQIGHAWDTISIKKLKYNDSNESGFDKTNSSLYQFEDVDSTRYHYVTITKFIIDDNDPKKTYKWMEVETWGKMRYIDFDEWMKEQSNLLGYGVVFLTYDKSDWESNIQLKRPLKLYQF